jgi:hypothetical protein
LNTNTKSVAKAARQPVLNLQIARTYLTATGPERAKTAGYSKPRDNAAAGGKTGFVSSLKLHFTSIMCGRYSAEFSPK